MSASLDSITGHSDYQLFCEERPGNPYPLYQRLRDADPVHRCAPMGLWLVTHYYDVLAGGRDPRFSTSRTAMYTRPLTPEMRIRLAPLLGHVSMWILLTDEPDHGRLRRLVNLTFTQRTLHRLRPRIQKVVDDLLATFEAGETVDILSDFCHPLPATVICEMLRIPLNQCDTSRLCTERSIGFASRGGPELARHGDDAMAALHTLFDMFNRLIEQHRRAPADDLMSAMIAAEEDGGHVRRVAPQIAEPVAGNPPDQVEAAG